MTARSHLGMTLLIAVLFTLCLGTSNILAASDLDDQQRMLPPEHLEFLDDPPGIPAQPVPGAQPATPHRIGPYTSVQVNTDAFGANIPGDAANEPTIAVDPTNPLRMSIGWRQFDTVSSNFRQGGTAYTTDGGRSWTFPGVLTPGTFRSDPVLAFDADGIFYYNSLESDFTTDVFTSTDGGMTWGPPVFAFGGDKAWMVCDRTGGIGHGHIYSEWAGGSSVFTRSVDGGQSFSSPTTIPSPPRWGAMDVAPDGTLYIVGVDSGLSSYLVTKSVDAQDASDPIPNFTTTTIDLGGNITWFTGPNPDGLLGQPWIAVDPSGGPNAGYIYVLGSCNPPGGDPLDVHFIRSTNGGSTWSAPVRVNDDPGTSDWQWFGTMSVAPNGRIDAVWNDTRNTGSQNWSQLFYSFSIDGGVTWSPNEQLSDAWDSFVGWPNQNKIGDYYHMRSDLVGADLAWASTLNGEQDVYYLRINDYDCNGNGIGDLLDISMGSPDANENGIPDECEGIVTDAPDLAGSVSDDLRNTPNPFEQSTTIRFDMPEGGGDAHLRIFNVGGQVVRTLFDGMAQGGPNSLTWDGNDDQGRPVAAGLYLYQLDREGTRDTKRMLLLR